MDKFEKHITDLKSGKEIALAFFMDKYGDALNFFAYKIISDKQACAEIVSDAFVKLWQKRMDFTAIQPLQSFLYRVTQNACLDFLRTNKNKYKEDQSALLELEASDQDIMKKIIYNELVQLLVEEIKKLPKQQAAVIHLAIMEGKNTEEICQELNTSSSAVYFARSKAIATLRKIFEQKKLSLHLSLFLAMCTS
ncbi:sigma-70 family RNA polymerase sigma factor [Sphingobacterium oryzagri]|uniref:Sigma-70 family RNA polymerase sigma factor n=1 Tax=Sphingobacterium oryzagri TaxID=3025669 RepID=A0ABY7WCC1_9SPHI|nr:sigma-70 family RNA polymerase sigma factor [Sphingobacterium sp. KACC 22765]WDF67308.1 sigma-70 family RNA polymerase sigma factor [Sphingobacterium sp. KACC 22765]